MPNTIKEQQAFSQQQLQGNRGVEHVTLAHDGDVMHAAIVAGKTVQARRNAIVFIHGTPGDWQNAGRYLLSDELTQASTVVSIDRPGWGSSMAAKADDQVAFTAQAEGIASVLRSLRSDKGIEHIVLAGHSLGASIAPRVAMDFPNLVDGLLLMAGSHNPELGGPRWYNRLAALPGAYCLLPGALAQSNREIMALKDNLLDMQPGWSQLRIPTVAIQGMQDSLVYPANIDFIESLVSEQNNIETVRLKDAGHLINLEHRPLVIDTLKTMLEGL